MVSILHISDLHIIKGAEWNNMRATLLEEAREKVHDRPAGEKMLVITGDFHNFKDSDYKEAEKFLHELFEAMAIEPHEDVFVVAGNHDVGNDMAMSAHFGADTEWELRKASALTSIKEKIKNGKSFDEFMKWRLESFIPYCEFVQKLGIYPDNSGTLPAEVHVGNWRGKLNILHLNTVLIADGTAKDEQIADTAKATDEEIWSDYYEDTIPTLALGHNSFYDLKENQQTQLVAVFGRKNVSAYLCGDRHKRETKINEQVIRLKSGHQVTPEIPNIVCMKGAADEADNYSEFGFYWHNWNEQTDEVELEDRKWELTEQSEFIPIGKTSYYYMRRKDVDGNSIEPRIKEQVSILADEREKVQKAKVEFENNMFQYYLNKWDGFLFMHRNTEKKIRLSDIYILPFYKESQSEKKDKTDLDNVIDLFLSDKSDGNDRNPVIILADAGMGKTSLISYICSKYPQNDNLIVLRFAEINRDIMNKSVLSGVLDELNCKESDLRNKRLIIDGFDEIKLSSDKNTLLSNFFNDCRNIRGLKVMVTSRVNYVDCNKFKNCNIIYLQFLRENQILDMSKEYFELSGETPFEIQNIASNEIIGVPLILYMILSLKIHVDENMGICELYEKIFALDGGIYDRMAMDNGEGYAEGTHPIAYDDVKKNVHLISQLIAFSMFEKSSETSSLSLEQDEYLNIAMSVSKDGVEDFAISNYYYIEASTHTLSFCHKTIYEYFVADYIFDEISKCSENEELAKKFARLLKYNILSDEILNFMKYKINKKYSGNDNVYLLIEATVNLMVKNGMIYFCNEKIVGILETEEIIFCNILRILDVYKIGLNYNNFKKIKMSLNLLRELNNSSNKVKINLKNSLFYAHNNFVDNMDVETYRFQKLDYTDFRGSKFVNMNFFNYRLSGVNFDGVSLSNVIFVGASLSNVMFVGASLSDVMFVGASLSNVMFDEASISGVFFDGASLSGVDFVGASLSNVYFRRAYLTGIKLYLCKGLKDIQFDKNTVLTDVTVDIALVEQLLLECNPDNLKGLKIYDTSSKSTISLEEYKSRFKHDINT